MPHHTPTAVRRIRLPVAATLLGCALLGGCQSHTNVAATGNTAAQFSHVFLTIDQIWFNTSATAGPTDSGWVKFSLSAPQTIDLVTLNNGTASQFAANLKLAAGTYNQIRVILADSTDALAASAQNAGAATNDEVDYFDTAAVPHVVPLAVLNAAQGISIGTSLTVAASASTSSAPSALTASSSATTSVIVDFDALRDLVPISLNGQPAFALDPHPYGGNTQNAGTIQGAVALTSVSTLTGAGNPDVQVAAEALSSDGTRHVIVATTRVGSDGTFILYPLSTAAGAASTYDLVIHGPAIQTVIIRSVPVTHSPPGSAAAVLGTLTLTAATPYPVNLATSAPASPTSSLVGFYQTLPLSSEVPYLVEVRAVDPTSGVFASDQELSNGAVQYGTYTSGPVSLTTVRPAQGAATYTIGAVNPAYGTATLGTTVTAAATGTTTVLFSMAAPPVPAGTTANAVSGTINVSTSAYDEAELFLTYNGALVAAAPLTSYLGRSQSTFTLSAIAPGGSATTAYAAGLYYAEVWAWNSTNPSGTLARMPYAGTLDLSAGDATGVSLEIK